MEDWKRRDNPIVRMRKWMERKGFWNDEMEKETRSSLRKDILRAFSEAEKEKKSPIRGMFEGTFENITEEQEAQMKELRRLIEKYPNEYDVSEFEDGVDSLPK